MFNPSFVKRDFLTTEDSPQTPAEIPRLPTDAARCRASRRLGDCRGEVETFFHENWPRLRSMMMQLEEESWDLSSQTRQGLSETEDVSPAFALPTPDDSDLSGSHLAREDGCRSFPPNSETPSTDRLSRLDREIEQRIRISRAQRT